MTQNFQANLKNKIILTVLKDYCITHTVQVLCMRMNLQTKYLIYLTIQLYTSLDNGTLKLNNSITVLTLTA